MAEKLSSGINLYDYMTDTNQEIYEGTFGKTDGTNPSSMEVINEFMENKITLNGEVNSKQNFNFTGSNGTVNALETGGKKLLLNVDEDHVEMATGRTWKEEYMSLLKQHGKEFASTGGAITVNNGIKGRVISGEIKGQTIKALTQPNNTYKKINYVGSTTAQFTLIDGLSKSGYIVGNNYTLVVFVNKNTLNKSVEFGVYGAMANIYWSPIGNAVPVGFTGIKKILINSSKQVTDTHYLATWGIQANTTGEVEFGFCILDGDWTNKDLFITEPISGLSSTQAVLNNNGSLFPIYEPLIVGKTRILDADTGLVPTDPLLPPLKDGDVLDLATKTITFANKSTQVLTDEQVKAYSKYKKVICLGGTTTKKDTLELKEDGSAVYTQNTKDATDGSARVDLTTPVVFSIDKSLMPTIATHYKINILNVESPVAPSEFKVSVPVDRIGELEARLQAIENVAYTPTNMSLSTNYIDDEYNKNLQTESEMI